MTDSPDAQIENRAPARAFVAPMATPLVATVIAILLLVAGLAFALQLERIGQAEKERQITVQAQTLASGIAAPLAFDDHAALQEYLNALRADPQIVAAAAYDGSGKFVAGYALPPAHYPARGGGSGTTIAGNALIVTAPVLQGNTQLGSVYLQSTLDSWSRRLNRYMGIAVIVFMASLLIVVLAASYSSLRKAHRELQEEIASRQQAEAALRQSQKMEAMGQLTGGVAHDFNNLLMVASGGLDLMERTTDPVKLEKLKTGIRQAVDRGAKLTQQLLAFSRRTPLKPEVIDLRLRVKGMDALLERSLGEGIKVAMHLPGDLWPVEVDASELEVAVLNIALNARDAMPKGGVIVIEAANVAGDADRQDRVRLAITDTGSGIAPELVAKIFEPFYTTKGVGQGTGLGLSQVYGFARASGGEVQVDSVPDRGTTMTLLLPRSRRAPAETHMPVDAVSASGRQRVLLVEDDDTVAATVIGMLEELGYENERVVSGDAALGLLTQDMGFSLVLSDMIMPGEVSGIDLVRIIRQKWPSVPTMLMTGYSAAAASAAREGVRLLTKPFSIQDLSVQMAAAMERGGRAGLRRTS